MNTYQTALNKLNGKPVTQITASELAAEILKAAEEVAASLTPEFKKFADRKINAARKSGTLPAAYKAGRDIEMMIDKN